MICTVSYSVVALIPDYSRHMKIRKNVGCYKVLFELFKLSD